MSHEIYYTSAPEGIKRGSSGFCTVAASENIPKALWDRLETLSAYRHHFAVGAGQNPVSHAHWILNVTGKTHHVLSRVCDSGVDHTQRTNAFAHHLVLENAEIQAALGGPAWMLEQPGVMRESWDGRVGALARNGTLPRGDIFTASRICAAWERATGDAGWGGHLADLFAKSPTRPVCILFSPGHEILPLIGEAIALLPPAARWNVTFNTYFTSMPTSATCVWRCCLAGTPAAQLGLRYAAGGLVLDLTDRSRLGTLPPGPYVTMARTGQAAEVSRPAAKTPAEQSAKPVAAPIKEKTPAKPAIAPEVDREEAEELARQDRFFDAIGNDAREGEIDFADELGDIARGEQRKPTAAERRRARQEELPVRMIRHAEEALRDAENEARHAASRRRRQVMLLFLGAVGAIGVGIGLIYMAARSMAPPDVGPSNNHSEVSVPRVDDVQPSPVKRTDALPPLTVKPEPTPTINQSRPAETPVAPIAVSFPDQITLGAMLERPNVGTGIGDRDQRIALKASDVDRAAGVRALRLNFARPAAGTGSASRSPGLYQSDDLGMLVAQQEARADRPGVAVRWKPPHESSTIPANEALYISYDGSGANPEIDFLWHSGLLVKNPAALQFSYWMLQNSTLELQSGGRRIQQIRLKPFDPPAINFEQAGTAISWPVDLPSNVTVVPPAASTLHAAADSGGAANTIGGWEASWYTDWEEKDAALRSAENASQVIKFKRATSVAAVSPWFLITFRPGMARVESTFSKRLEADQRDLAQYQSELRALDSQVDQAKAANSGLTANPIPADLAAKRQQTAVLVAAYKEAVAGYKELTRFDIAFDLPDGVRLATLHFQRPDKSEAGK